MAGQVSILDGNTFLISDGNGDVEASPVEPIGLYSFDVRFLSTWVLTVNGERLHALSVDDLANFETRFFLVPGQPTHYVDADISVIRQRRITGGIEEQLTVLNHATEPAEVTVRLEIGSDFGSVLGFSSPLPHQGKTSVSVGEDMLRLRYEREFFRRETVVASSAPVDVDPQGMTFRLRIPPDGVWTTTLDVTTSILGPDDRDVREGLVSFKNRSRKELQDELDEWLASAPRLGCECQPLEMTYRRSLIDLAALRYRPMLLAGEIWVAGLPWFMTFFCRDAMITCLQALPFKPEMTPVILRAAFLGQGVKLDDFREEEPGKIYHEINYGELSAFQEMPQSPYFGAADITPLAVILLDEYERWTGDVDLVREFEPEARAALSWIDTYADLLGNGYVWYQRRNPDTGLENQGWKGSADAISYRDGRIPPAPRAPCELQGYAYDAKLRGARMARAFWGDPAYADQLERSAADLKDRFNRDYWVEDGQYYALALDRDGQPVDALASNMGHLLWSGIVEPDRAAKVAEHLLGPRLFSGWGVRTLAEGEGRYNPVGYHVGTVWPFDNSIIAWGLRRYGFAEEAGRIADGIFGAARFFGGRLPEAFAGYDRRLTRYPVRYPTACSPQSLAAGAPLLLIRSMLGLQPQGERLVVDPALPRGVGRIELLDIPGRWGQTDAFGRDRHGR
nr:glycogen debranching N-terminal domain-containing protein [Micromonospora sp. DSM 115978]